MSILDTDQLENLYDWLDSIPFSRLKKNLARDFSDGVLVAELVSSFFPHLVQMHNYTPSHATFRKKANWETLSRKVLIRLDCPVSESTINDLVSAKLEVTENFLHTLRCKIQEKLNKRKGVGQQKRQQQTSSYFQESFPGQGRVDQYGDESFTRQIDAAYQPKQETKIGDHRSAVSDQTGMNSTERKSKPNQTKNTPVIQASNQYTPAYPTSMYEQREQEILLKEESIQVLQARIRRLENTVQLKERIIDELRKELEQLNGGHVRGNDAIQDFARPQLASKRTK